MQLIFRPWSWRSIISFLIWSFLPILLNLEYYIGKFLEDVPFSDSIANVILISSKCFYLLALPSLMGYLLEKVGMLSTPVSTLCNKWEMGLLLIWGLYMNMIHIMRCFMDYNNYCIWIPVAAANIFYEFVLINSGMTFLMFNFWGISHFGVYHILGYITFWGISHFGVYHILLKCHLLVDKTVYIF